MAIFLCDCWSWALRTLRAFWLRLLLLFERCHSSELEHKLQSELGLTHADKQKPTDGCLLRLEMPKAKGLPLVGTFFDLIAAGAAPQLHRYIDRRHQQLGPIFYERLGGTQDAVFVASASLMRAVFHYEGQYPRHPLPDAWTIYNKQLNCQRGLFFMEGAEWFHNRRILNRFLLNGSLDWMDRYIETCTERVVNQWKAKAAQAPGADCEVHNLEQQLYRWAIDVICAIMFGCCSTGCQQLESALDDLSRIVHKIFESSSMLMNFPPQLAKLLNLRIWRDFEAHVTAVLQQSFDIIDMFMVQKSKDANELAAEVEAEALFCKLQAVGMPLGTIKRIFVDLVIAAGDTTAYTTEWALYLLSKDCGLQQRLANVVTAGDSENTELLMRGLIKETLRLYPIAPFVGRYLASDANIGGHCVKKDTLVLLSLYTAGREASHFPEPLAVKPERWLRNPETGELQQVLQAHGSMPFAIGNRSCIGRRVAIKQIQCLLTAIVSNFTLQCNNPTPIDSILRLVTVPAQPLQLGIKLHKMLYLWNILVRALRPLSNSLSRLPIFWTKLHVAGLALKIVGFVNLY